MEYQFDNYEIAAVESPVSLHKPILTIKYTHVYVNAELLKSAPDMVYVQFLIDRAAKKMILRPCDKGEKEYVRLRTLNDISAKPRHILSGEFSQRMFEFMQWDIKFRYRLSGTPVITGGVSYNFSSPDLMRSTMFGISAHDRFARQIKFSTDILNLPEITSAAIEGSTACK